MPLHSLSPGNAVMEVTVKAGFTKGYRRELNSDIWKMPPLYQRLFYYLRQIAAWKSEVFPTRKIYGIALNPGQIITSLSNIAEGVSWHKYGVKKVPNKKTIKDILSWLEGNAMITVVSNRHGTFINITNWHTYNHAEDEKVTQKVTRKYLNVDTLKEDKELKKRNIYSAVVSHLNEKTGTKYKSTTKKTKAFIKARLAEGFSVEDFRAVIDHKSAEWNADPKYYKYLRPQTLFGTNFESYLQNAITQPQNKSQMPRN